METLFRQIGEVIKKEVLYDIKNNKNLDLLRDVYNYWRDEEHDGIEYIFSIYDKKDLKYLVNNDIISATEIAWAVNGNNNGLFFFPCDVCASGMQGVKTDDLKQMIEINIENIIPNVFKYVGRGMNTPYQDFYELYVVQRLEKVIH